MSRLLDRIIAIEDEEDSRVDRLDCARCGGQKTMRRERVPRFLAGLRLAGTVIVLPCLAVIGLALLALVPVFTAGRVDPPPGPLAVGIGILVPVAMIIGSTALGAVGWFFCSSRTVWLCSRCRCWVERA